MSEASTPNAGAESSVQTPGWRARLSTLRPWLDLLPVAILCAVAVFEIASVARAGGDTGSDEEWERAADNVRERWQIGDLVVFAPAWIDPVGRQHMGELLTLDDAARMDAARYGVVWELSIRGGVSPERVGRTLEEAIEVGPITIRKWTRDPVRVLTDFRNAFPNAVSRGQIVATPRLGLEEVGFEPHRCVVTIPRPDGTVEIEFPDVELGSSLVGYVGLGDVFTRRDVREPGRLDLLIDNSAATSVTFGVNDGWVRFEAQTSPGFSSVTFRLTAVGPKARNRRICFAAEARQ